MWPPPDESGHTPTREPLCTPAAASTFASNQSAGATGLAELVMVDVDDDVLDAVAVAVDEAVAVGVRE